MALQIVCLPDGLPLASSMTFDLSIDRLKKFDKLSIKNLKTLENIGAVTEIVTGKTATLS